jgi:hypothetical protein
MSRSPRRRTPVRRRAAPGARGERRASRLWSSNQNDRCNTTGTDDDLSHDLLSPPKRIRGHHFSRPGESSRQLRRGITADPSKRFVANVVMIDLVYAPEALVSRSGLGPAAANVYAHVVRVEPTPPGWQCM